MDRKALLATGASSYRAYSDDPIGTFELERADAEGGEGVGAVRLFRTRRYGRTYASHEELVELVPGRRLSCRLVAGLALRGYRADIDLTPVEAGTEARLHTTFHAKVPGTGALYRRSLEDVTRACVAGLAKRATASDQAA